MVVVNLGRSGISNFDESIDLRAKQDLFQASTVHPQGQEHLLHQFSLYSSLHANLC